MQKIYCYYACYSMKNPGENLPDEHKAGRALLAIALDRVFGLDLSRETLGIGSHGKPYIEGRPNLHFNISHSGNYVVCAIAPDSVGIDIQLHKDIDFEKVRKKAFRPEEIQEMEKSQDPKSYFFNRWTLKEAWLKWKGIGISRDLTCDMSSGWKTFLDFGAGVSCALCTSKEIPLEMVELDWEFLTQIV